MSHLFALLILNKLQSAFNIVLEEVRRTAEERLNISIRVALLKIIKFGQALVYEYINKVS